jgi:hypothetical protein
MMIGCQEVLESYGAESLQEELVALKEVVGLARKDGRSSEGEEAQHRYVEFDHHFFSLLNTHKQSLIAKKH